MSLITEEERVHLTPIFFSVEMKLSNIHKRNLPIFLISDIFKGRTEGREEQKVAEI